MKNHNLLWSELKLNTLPPAGSDAWPHSVEGNVTSTAMLIQQGPEGPFAALENEDASGKMANLRLGVNYAPSTERTFTLTSYLMREDRDDASKLRQNRITYDIDTQVDQALFAGNTLQVGLGARWLLDELNSGPSAFVSDPERTLKFFSAFLQDNQKFFDQDLTVSLGNKITDNPYTGIDHQPSVRASYLLNEEHSIWGAISRAVRVPERIEAEATAWVLSLPGTPQGFVVPPSAVGVEKVTALEIGHRWSKEWFSLDLTGFYDRYSRLRAYRSSIEDLFVGDFLGFKHCWSRVNLVGSSTVQCMVPRRP